MLERYSKEPGQQHSRYDEEAQCCEEMPQVLRMVHQYPLRLHVGLKREKMMAGWLGMEEAKNRMKETPYR